MRCPVFGSCYDPEWCEQGGDCHLAKKEVK